MSSSRQRDRNCSRCRSSRLALRRRARSAGARATGSDGAVRSRAEFGAWPRAFTRRGAGMASHSVRSTRAGAWAWPRRPCVGGSLYENPRFPRFTTAWSAPECSAINSARMPSTCRSRSVKRMSQIGQRNTSDSDLTFRCGSASEQNAPACGAHAALRHGCCIGRSVTGQIRLMRSCATCGAPPSDIAAKTCRGPARRRVGRRAGTCRARRPR